jgi:hypothetical protein
MDRVLILFGSFLPVAYTLLGLWIKAFDKEQRLTRTGTFILPGLVAVAMLAYSVNGLKSGLAGMSGAREKSAAQYELIKELDGVTGDQMLLTLSGAAESISASSHPRFLQKNWRVSLNVGGTTLTAIPIAGATQPSRPANDEEEGRLYPETRDYSHFSGSFGELKHTESWNSKSITLQMEGPASFFVGYPLDWILRDSEEDYFDKQRKAEGIEPPPDPDEDPEDHDKWRILPMRVAAHLVVKGVEIGRSEGHVYYYASADDGPDGTVKVDMPPIVVAPKAFKTAEDFMTPPDRAALDQIMLMRVLAWIGAALALLTAAAAVRIQLREQRTASGLAQPQRVES